MLHAAWTHAACETWTRQGRFCSSRNLHAPLFCSQHSHCMLLCICPQICRLGFHCFLPVSIPIWMSSCTCPERAPEGTQLSYGSQGCMIGWELSSSPAASCKASGRGLVGMNEDGLTRNVPGLRGLLPRWSDGDGPEQSRKSRSDTIRVRNASRL